MQAGRTAKSLCRRRVQSQKNTDYLQTHKIKYKPRPTRRHNKVYIVERKNETLKEIIRRLDDDITTANSDAIVARATFLSNIFSGSRLMSSFELARGYSPSILGLPRTDVTQELLHAHQEQVATRALQILLHSRLPYSPTPDIFSPNDNVWVFYNNSKQNVKAEWIKAKFIKAGKHHLIARRSQHGPNARGIRRRTSGSPWSTHSTAPVLFRRTRTRI